MLGTAQNLSQLSASSSAFSVSFASTARGANTPFHALQVLWSEFCSFCDHYQRNNEWKRREMYTGESSQGGELKEMDEEMKWRREERRKRKKGEPKRVARPGLASQANV
jgi:hypothetical protein